MSGRGGRGGGRGSRGGRGGRGGSKPGPPGLPGFDNETNLLMSREPQETYPKSYKPPIAPNLTPDEARCVASLVAFRRAFHNSPLYTHRHITSEMMTTAAASAGTSTTTTLSDPVPRMYGQAQVNARYGVKNRATLDPFLAVPMYSHRFVDESRALPELKGRPYAKDFFPEELWATLDGKDKGGPKGSGGGGPKSSTAAAATAAAAAAAAVNGQDKPRGTKRGRPVVGEDDDVDDPFGDLNDDEAAFQSLHGGRRKPETEEERKKRIAEAAGKAEENNNNEDGGGGGAEGVNLDDEEQELSQEDDDYEDDEDGGDYDAEQYFDDGADNEMEDDGGVGESAMDF